MTLSARPPTAQLPPEHDTRHPRGNPGVSSFRAAGDPSTNGAFALAMADVKSGYIEGPAYDWIFIILSPVWEIGRAHV